MGNLTAKQIENARPGRYSDRDGLILIVRPKAGDPEIPGGRFWAYKGTIHGKRREWGLGPVKDVSLSAARAGAVKYRNLIRDGIDPATDKKERAAKERLNAQSSVTFADAATAAWEAKRSGFRNDKHRAQWIGTLQTFAFPVMGNVPVAEIDKAHIAKVLTTPIGDDRKPLWLARHETASRVYQRICHVLNWAIAADARQAPPPTRQTMANMLPAVPSTADNHHEAMPYSEVPNFYKALAANDAQTMGRLALRFAMLTSTRSGEVRGATWGEIDFSKARWTIPARRMKKEREHVVPLSGESISLLRYAGQAGMTGLIFSGTSGKPLSDMTLGKVLRDMGLSCTVHGFRSSFRDWAGETTDHSREVIEHALAHRLADKAEAAYQRGTLLVKRAILMDDWACYLRGEAQTIPYFNGIVMANNEPGALCIGGMAGMAAMQFGPG